MTTRIPSRARARRAVPGWQSLTDRLVGFRTPREVPLDLATSAVAGPLQLTSQGVFCWFELGAQNWDFKTHTERVQLWDQVTYRLGALTASVGVEVEGRPIRIRVTTRPYPAFEFARRLDEASPHRLPDVAEETWDRYLQHAQQRLQSTGLDQKLVAVGLWVHPPVPKAVAHELVAGTEHPDSATVKVLNEVATVTRIMAAPGFDAKPLSARDMAFLFHRSLSIGTPVPAAAGLGGSRWEPGQLAAAVERCAWTAEPFGTTVTVHTERQGQAVERHVAVVSLGSMPDQTWPDNGREPWMLALDTLPFGVEWSLNGTLLRPSVLEGTLAREQLRAEAIRRHYHEHKLTPPPAVDRAIHAATSNLDEVTEGDLRAAARFLGTIRVATFADTRQQAVEQAAQVVVRFGERFHIEAAHVLGQPAQLREFIPGEARVKEGFQRRLPIKYLAAGLPNVGADLGTPAGPYLGYGSGTARRAVCFDMHYGPEVLNSPGLFTISAEPGAGKSVLIGALAYNAARAGEPTIILDPSGPLAALCDLPELAPFARKLDLTAAEPGTLSPYQLIPDPQPESFRRPDGIVDLNEFGRATRRAEAERQQLMFDVLRMWLPSNVLKMVGTDVLLLEVVRGVRQQVTERKLRDSQANPRWIITQLRHIAAHDGNERRRELSGHVAEELAAAAEFPLGELIVPAHEEPLVDQGAADATLVVVTMPGLSAPPEGTDREFWGAEERYTQPLLHLAAFFASKFVYSRPREVRKNIFLDENHLMGQWGSGRAFFVRLSRDSRKWNTAVGAASQHPDDHLSIGRVDALIGSAFVGRLKSPTAAAKACQLLAVSADYAPVIQGLSPRADDTSRTGETGEFVWRDPRGRVGRLRVDLDWHPSLRKALQTTPGRPRRQHDLGPQPAPFIDPDLFDTIPVLDHPDQEATS